MNPENCTLCPRHCGHDRTKSAGFCGGGMRVRVARAALHQWEEPCISGSGGSGTVFFSGCPLRCCFCQNSEISAGNFGKEISNERLAEIFLELQDQGAHNINLVNPTHYAPWVAQALQLAKPRLQIPVVCNSGGYESEETLRILKGEIQIYLPDLKYADGARAARYSGAGDYFPVATNAIMEMYRQTGKIELDADGVLQKGLLIRHLVMPNGYRDSIAVIEWIADNLPLDDIYVSVMSQFTPFYRCSEFPEINRRVSSYEYNKVLERARILGVRGFMQERNAAREEYTPAFDLSGV